MRKNTKHLLCPGTVLNTLQILSSVIQQVSNKIIVNIYKDSLSKHIHPQTTFWNGHSY
jgi:hypothetical protein